MFWFSLGQRVPEHPEGQPGPRRALSHPHEGAREVLLQCGALQELMTTLQEEWNQEITAYG